MTEELEHRLVVELVGAVSGKRLLALGCGDGLLTSAIAARGARVVGLDADSRMLAAAVTTAERARVRPCFIQGRVERRPFPSFAFDAVVAVTLFCLLPDPATAAREAVRVLRPGGRFVIGDLGRWSIWAALRRVRGRLGADTWRDAHFSTPAELRALFDGAGGSVEAVRGSVYCPPIAPLAKLIASADRCIGSLSTFGAGFLAITGTKQ